MGQERRMYKELEIYGTEVLEKLFKLWLVTLVELMTYLFVSFPYKLCKVSVLTHLVPFKL